MIECDAGALSDCFTIEFESMIKEGYSIDLPLLQKCSINEETRPRADLLFESKCMCMNSVIR